MATKEYLLKALKIVGESFITRLLIDAILSLHATLPIALLTLFKTSSILLSTLIIYFLLYSFSLFYKIIRLLQCFMQGLFSLGFLLSLCLV